MQIEINAAGMQVGEELNKVLKAATQPINGPRHHHVDSAIQVNILPWTKEQALEAVNICHKAARLTILGRYVMRAWVWDITTRIAVGAVPG
jgi:hypothetical protein